MFKKRIARSILPFCWTLLYKISNFHSVPYILYSIDYICLFVWIHDKTLISQLSKVCHVPKWLEEYSLVVFVCVINKYIRNRSSVMAKKCHHILIKGMHHRHPFMKQKCSSQITKILWCTFLERKRRKQSHYWYVDIEKYETVERSKCVVRFVGKVPNGAGITHNHYGPRRLVWYYNRFGQLERCNKQDS